MLSTVDDVDDKRIPQKKFVKDASSFQFYLYCDRVRCHEAVERYAMRQLNTTQAQPLCCFEEENNAD